MMPKAAPVAARPKGEPFAPKNLDQVIYTQRPHTGLSLWIPVSLAQSLGVKEGDRLTDRQFNDRELQTIIGARSKATKKGDLE